jgi:GNAT superfamily N-acetyltransferase
MNLIIRPFGLSDADDLADYFIGLSHETTRRYGPHPFDRATIVEIFSGNTGLLGYIAIEQDNQSIIAYSVIKYGVIHHDQVRLESYGLKINNQTDCTYAPSVADAWQSCGVGNLMFQFILDDLKSMGFRRIILWGGVQADNLKAVNFYRKNGFQEVGRFEHNGNNLDMIRDNNY